MQYSPLLFISGILIFASHRIFAEEVTFQNRVGLSYITGQMVDPNSDSYINAVSFSYLTPNNIFIGQTAPEYIRIRNELTFANVSNTTHGIYLSAVFMAVRYLNMNPKSTWRPYIEGGVGLSYASYKIEGQAYNVNFNPQIGFGTDYTTSAGNTYFSSLRFSHFSNASLNKDNEGTNTVNLSIGRYF